MKRSFILFLILISNAGASTGSLYGYGSKASALGNTLLSGSEEAFATYYNPAAQSKNDGVRFGYGLSYAHPEFRKISGVITDNTATSPAGNTTGNIDTDDYLDHFAQILAMSYNFGENVKKLSVGFLGTMPLNRLAYLDTGNAFRPEYYNYRSSTQRPEIYFGAGFAASEKFQFGAGVKFVSNVSSSGNYTISSSNGTVSYGRLTTTVKPSIAGYFSTQYIPNEESKLALIARMPAKYKLNVEVRSNARVLGPANDFPVQYDSASTVFYDPLEIDLAYSRNFNNGFWGTVEIDWVNTSNTETAALTVVDAGTSVALKNSVSTRPDMRDIFVPKVGVEKRFYSTTYRAGYFYRPTAVKDNSGVGNLVDPSKHVFTLGVGFDLKKASVTSRQIVIDVHGQYHWLVRETVKKTGVNEAGSASSSKVGSPEFDIGGKIYGAGVSVSMLF